MEAVAETTALAIPAAALPGLPRNFRRLAGIRPGFTFLEPAAAGRAQAEAYVANCFADAYRAQVTSFAPQLFAMSCAGRLSAVAGIRSAEREALFLEQYLDDPVEQAVAAAYGKPAPREQIFELCSLASRRPGISYLLYVMLAHVMHRAGYRYAIFSGTRQVARIVDKLQFVVADLAPADPARLGPAAADWGDYYRTEPRVMAIDIAASLQGFKALSVQTAVAGLFADEIGRLATAFSFAQARLPAAQV